MVGYVLWALLIYSAYVFAHGLLNLTSTTKSEGGNLLAIGLGSRDGVGAKTSAAARAGRAQRNMEESLFFFLPLALLLLHTGKADGIALTGALIYVAARAVYLPVYIAGVFAMRSVVWIAGAAGIVMMIVRLHGQARRRMPFFAHTARIRHWTNARHSATAAL